MRTFLFISIPLHSSNSSIGLLYKILTLIPLIPTHSFLHSQPIPRIFALIPSIHPLIPRIPIISTVIPAFPSFPLFRFPIPNSSFYRQRQWCNVLKF